MRVFCTQESSGWSRKGGWSWSLPLVLLLTASGQAQVFDYLDDNGGIRITAFHDPTGAVAAVIPSTISGLPVTSLGDYAFRFYSQLVSVTIPNGVTNIGSFCFQGCSLTNFAVPDTVATIGDFAFGLCGGLTSVTIPNSVTSLGSYVFEMCSNLTNITFGNGIGSIPEGTFNSCRALTNVNIPTSVTNIGPGAFQGCTSLQTLTLPSRVTSIGGDAFAQCISLSSINIPGGVTSIDVRAFSQCASLLNIIIPVGVTNIAEGAFGYCGLTNVSLPDTLISIDDGAFADCTRLTSIMVPKSVTSIDPTAFGGCLNLTNLLVDPLNPLYSARDGGLFDKSGQTLIACPPAKAGSYNIPFGVTDIGPDAFYNCSSLGTVLLPDTITNIGVDAFQYFVGLTNIAIPDSVVTIGSNAFQFCISLSDVTIGSGVTNIDDYAFSECTNLHGIYFKGNAPTLSGNNVFWSVIVSPPIYYLPGTSGWGPTFGGFRTLLWNPQIRTSDSSFGVQKNGFGFNIAGTANIPLVIEGCNSLSLPAWVALQTCTLTNGLIYFSDPQWTDHPSRLYRIRSP